MNERKREALWTLWGIEIIRNTRLPDGTVVWDSLDENARRAVEAARKIARDTMDSNEPGERRTEERGTE